MNLFIQYDNFSPNGVGVNEVALTCTPKALTALLLPLLQGCQGKQEGLTEKAIKDILVGAASLSPLTDKLALLEYKTS